MELKELVARLTFPEESLSVAVLEQAMLFLQASNYRIKKMKMRQQAEAEAEELRAGLSIAYRNKDAQAQKKKSMTERYLADLLDRSPKMRVAKAKLALAERGEEWSKLLLEAYRQRRDSLKVLASFVFMEDQFRVSKDDAQRKMKQARQRMQTEMGVQEEDV